MITTIFVENTDVNQDFNLIAIYVENTMNILIMAIFVEFNLIAIYIENTDVNTDFNLIMAVFVKFNLRAIYVENTMSNLIMAIFGETTRRPSPTAGR